MKKLILTLTLAFSLQPLAFCGRYAPITADTNAGATQYVVYPSNIWRSNAPAIIDALTNAGFTASGGGGNGPGTNTYATNSGTANNASNLLSGATVVAPLSLTNTSPAWGLYFGTAGGQSPSLATWAGTIQNWLIADYSQQYGFFNFFNNLNDGDQLRLYTNSTSMFLGPLVANEQITTTGTSPNFVYHTNWGTFESTNAGTSNDFKITTNGWTHSIAGVPVAYDTHGTLFATVITNSALTNCPFNSAIGATNTGANSLGPTAITGGAVIDLVSAGSITPGTLNIGDFSVSDQTPGSIEQMYFAIAYIPGIQIGQYIFDTGQQSGATGAGVVMTNGPLNIYGPQTNWNVQDFTNAGFTWNLLTSPTGFTNSEPGLVTVYKGITNTLVNGQYTSVGNQGDGAVQTNSWGVAGFSGSFSGNGNGLTNLAGSSLTGALTASSNINLSGAVFGVSNSIAGTTNIVLNTAGTAAMANMTWSSNEYANNECGGFLYMTNGPGTSTAIAWVTIYFPVPFPYGSPPMVIAREFGTNAVARVFNFGAVHITTNSFQLVGSDSCVTNVGYGAAWLIQGQTNWTGGTIN